MPNNTVNQQDPRDYPAKTALALVAAVIGGIAVLAFAPWARIVGLSEIPIRTPVPDVVHHIHEHFTKPDLSRRNDWNDRQKWHYRFDAVLQQKDFGMATFTIDYTFKEDILDSMSAYFSSVAL